MKKVLAVDDSQAMLKMVQQTLQIGGYEVLVASDGKEALEKFRGAGVELLITDINMPVMDGLRFPDGRKQSGLFTEIPVIIISTEGKEADTARGMALGAAGYVCKPFRPAQLHAVIDGLFESRSGPEAP